MTTPSFLDALSDRPYRSYAEQCFYKFFMHSKAEIMRAGLPATTEIYTFADSGKFEDGPMLFVRISTHPNVHTVARIPDGAVMTMTAYGGTAYLARRWRSLLLRHFAAWSIGAFEGWRI